MSNSTNLVLPYLAEGQAQKHVTVNETIRKLDAIVQITVESATTTAEPGAPGDGETYIVPSGKTGSNWSAFTNNAIGYYRDGAWEQITPREGWLAWVRDSGAMLVYDGAAWSTSKIRDGLELGTSDTPTFAGAAFSNGGFGVSVGPNTITLDRAGASYLSFSSVGGYGIIRGSVSAANDTNIATVSPTNGLDVHLGLRVGVPTGAFKGVGAINAQSVYDDNNLLSCYVFDAALDGDFSMEKWDRKVPDRDHPAQTVDDDTGLVSEAGAPILKTRIVRAARTEARRHDPARKFKARLGTQHDPLTLNGYAKHWKEKRHLTSMPNEASFEHAAMSTGEWIQRLVETVEIQAVLIEELNQRTRDHAPQE